MRITIFLILLPTILMGQEFISTQYSINGDKINATTVLSLYEDSLVIGSTTYVFAEAEYMPQHDVYVSPNGDTILVKLKNDIIGEIWITSPRRQVKYFQKKWWQWRTFF